MKAAEIRSLSPKELETELAKRRREVLDLRFQAAIGQLTDNHRIGRLKREIARFLTIRRQKELGL